MAMNGAAVHEVNRSPALAHPSHRAVEALGLVLFTVVSAAVSLLVLEWRIYHDILTPADTPLGFTASLLVGWTVWSKSVLMLLPALLVALGLLLFGRVTTAWVWYGLAAFGTYAFIATDLLIYNSYGRHLLNLMTFIGQPEALDFVGGISRWLTMPVVAWTITAIAVLGLAWLARRYTGRIPRVQVLFGSPRPAANAALLLMTVVLAPLALRNFTYQAFLFDRTCAIFPIDVRTVDVRLAPAEFDDPVLAEIDQGLRDVYAKHFADVMRPTPIDPSAVFDGRSKPNVILIVLESLNHEIATGGAMPRLTAWGRQGMVFHRHYSGSNHTEPGLFTLLYARPALVYFPTLDGGVVPQACFTFSRSGYETGYFSGVSNSKWLGMGQFINEHTFERYVFEAVRREGGWPAWDRAALRELAMAANEPRQRPLFALCFLNSSHMDYDYPPEYEEEGIGEPDPSRYPRGQYGPEQLQNLRDYHRTLAFLDDEIAKTIESLDPANNIIVVTGDHGESLYQDGLLGHFTLLSDAQARVPLFIVGPRVPHMEIHTATTHADVLPTLLHALTGRRVPIARSSGRDVLAGPMPDEALLFSVHQDRYLKILAIRGGDRLAFDLSCESPDLRTRGFQNPQARLLVNHGQTAADAQTWVRFIEQQFRLLRP